ncbi:MAG: hypothetical protein A2928_01985 [Candidatus Taylorbacteria bacterium RIFCSPLOWO2_01_FULL_45_15b]|uniref:FAD/NAD(P)-binding domain-containing protein n=1 Tax=Candidatus Taylorbacteria bacterium RIFCSPLOWO2_01_FULL_45_15b TaxID=1802319 RepID=A0A1G2NCB8_9BACT|nr:MAG: hypothetical protein A2928_01985 [Candidatus Taylorbacteria bacterium RIFCSPLOWO2_01_FULL_45_15b]
MKKILIVGGGFAGISAARRLAKLVPADVKITLISEKTHFEYHAALYRVVAGRSPLEVCVPLSYVIPEERVEIVSDRVVEILPEVKEIRGASGSRYRADYIVLTLGSKTGYFDISGIKEFSFGFKSIDDALRLRRHIHELFEECKERADDVSRDFRRMHFVLVGGGASGVELAGELADYTRRLAKKHGIDDSLIEIDIVEAGPRLLSNFEKDVSHRVELRLRALGINVFLNRPLLKEDVEGIMLKGMSVEADTIIWTAGVKAHDLYGATKGFSTDKKGRVIVDKYLQPMGHSNIFVAGDAAATLYSGMAQTAIRDGVLISRNILRDIKMRPMVGYKAIPPAYSIPVGPNFAATIFSFFSFYGRFGWYLRRMADLRFFMSILPFSYAWKAWAAGRVLSESCPVCIESLRRYDIAK